MEAKSRKDLAKIEASLLERKKELEEELRRLHSEKTSDDQVQDPGDQTMTAVLENLKSSLEHTEYEEFRMILKALEKIKSGKYGMCGDCDTAISEKRLELYPNATRCLLCQEKAEENNVGRTMYKLI